MRAELKSLFSPDADPLEDFAPTGPFGVLVMAMIGPAGQQGHESFDFMLCTPEWFASNIREDFKLGRHYLFVRDFDYTQLEKFVREYCESCGETPTWSALAEKLARLGIMGVRRLHSIPDPTTRMVATQRWAKRSVPTIF